MAGSRQVPHVALGLEVVFPSVLKVPISRRLAVASRDCRNSRSRSRMIQSGSTRSARACLSRDSLGWVGTNRDR